jgi:hypothetical protein
MSNEQILNEEIFVNQTKENISEDLDNLKLYFIEKG